MSWGIHFSYGSVMKLSSSETVFGGFGQFAISEYSWGNIFSRAYLDYFTFGVSSSRDRNNLPLPAYPGTLKGAGIGLSLGANVALDNRFKIAPEAFFKVAKLTNATNASIYGMALYLLGDI